MRARPKFRAGDACVVSPDSRDLGAAGEDVRARRGFAGDGEPGGDDALAGTRGIQECAALEGVEEGAGGHGREDEGVGGGGVLRTED